jgi:nanoRNase/pAp phosphatase (c-di-AMP/oligoRNAs hydrolase)
VAAVAEAFQGGGHKNAAGCTLIGSLPEVRERVLGEIRRVVTAMGGESADGKG